MTKTEEQIVALAGLFQAMSVVHKIAQSGTHTPEELETSLRSLFVTNPSTTLDVFDGNLAQLKEGLQVTKALLNKTETVDLKYVVRYALAILHLERKLQKDERMLNTIATRMEKAKLQVEHFDIAHENVIKNIASIYTDTISTFQLRLQISGHERFLTVELNAAKIRSLLLAGIRAAMLWRQLKGHRWHFIFKRKALIQACDNLLDQC